MKISFFVPGKAAPGGSKKGFVHRHTGRVIITDDAKGNRDWKSRVAVFAKEAYQGEPLKGPLEVEFAFYVPWLKGHFGTGRNAGRLKANAPRWPVVRPDTTKLIRSTEDALKGICWADDAQIVRQTGIKEYGTLTGVRITIWTMEDDR